MTPTTDAEAGVWNAVGEGLDLLGFVILALVVAAVPLLHGALAPGPALVFRLLGICAWLAVGAGVVLRGRVAVPAPLPALVLLAYVAIIAWAAARSPYAFGSEVVALDTGLAASGFLLATVSVRTRRRRRALVGAFLAGASIVAALGALQASGLHVLGTDLVGEAPQGRASSLYENPNHFAGLLDLAAPLALACVLFGRPWWLRLVALTVAALLYANVGATYSYGGWMAAGVGAAVLLAAWALHGWMRDRSLLPLAGAAALAALAVAAGVYLLDASPRLRGTTQERLAQVLDVGELGSFQSRRAIQTASLELVLDRRWSGVGPGNFTDAIVAYRPERITRPGESFLHRTLLHAMNDLLNAAAAGGLPAAAAFALFWLLVLARAPSASPGSPTIRFGVAAALAAVLAHGTVDGNLTFVPGNAFLAFALAGVLHVGVGVAHSTSHDVPRASEHAGA